MVRHDIVSYLRAQLKQFSVEDLRKQLASEGVNNIDFEDSLAIARQANDSNGRLFRRQRSLGYDMVVYALAFLASITISGIYGFIFWVDRPGGGVFLTLLIICFVLCNAYSAGAWGASSLTIGQRLGSVQIVRPDGQPAGTLRRLARNAAFWSILTAPIVVFIYFKSAGLAWLLGVFTLFSLWNILGLIGFVEGLYEVISRTRVDRVELEQDAESERLRLLSKFWRMVILVGPPLLLLRVFLIIVNSYSVLHLLALLLGPLYILLILIYIPFILRWKVD